MQGAHPTRRHEKGSWAAGTSLRWRTKRCDVRARPHLLRSQCHSRARSGMRVLVLTRMCPPPTRRRYWTAFYPADTVKSYIQTDPRFTSSSVYQVGKDIYKEHGLTGLYRGWVNAHFCTMLWLSLRMPCSVCHLVGPWFTQHMHACCVSRSFRASRWLERHRHML